MLKLVRFMRNMGLLTALTSDLASIQSNDAGIAWAEQVLVVIARCCSVFSVQVLRQLSAGGAQWCSHETVPVASARTWRTVRKFDAPVVQQNTISIPLPRR